MASFNKVLLMGNLTRDIEVRHTPSNQAVARIGLAVNRKYRTKDNEEREETTFVNCEAWGKTGEIMAQYLRKGSPVFIEGRLKLDQWEDKDGQKRSAMNVVVENFQFIGAPAGAGGGRRVEADAPEGGRAGPRGRPQEPIEAPQHVPEDEPPF
ncbi:MAG: single-stranded DNA-binding protein [Phycisphaerales bacterium]